MAPQPTDRPEPRGGKRLIARKEAMYRLGIGRQKWHELVRANRIPISRVGGRVVIRSDLLDELIEDPERMNEPSGEPPKERS